MAGTKKTTYKALGLYTFPNQLSAPEGAMSSASNVNVDAPGVIQSNRSRASYNFGPLTSGANGTAFPVRPGGDPSSSVFINQVSSFSTFTVPDHGVFQLFGSEVQSVNNAGTLARLSYASSAFHAAGNNYLMCGGSNGGKWSLAKDKVFRIDSVAGTTRSTGCGMAEALTPADYIGTPTFGGGGATAPAYGLPLTGQPAFGVAASPILSTYSTGGAVAYRALLLTRDTSGNLIRGAPSGRLVISQSGSYTYGLVMPLPSGQCFAGDILQLYRSETLPAVVVTATGLEPSDDMRQVWEYVLAAADITRGYVTLAKEVAPDSMRGGALYTNDTQEGIGQGNQRPPSSALGVYHKSVAWYGGVAQKSSSVTITIIGQDGWAVGNTISVAGNTYTAVAPATGEDWPNKKWVLYTAGSAAQNAANTARSIARCISYNNASVYAWYATPANSTQFSIVIRPTAAGVSGTALAGVTGTMPSNTVSPVISGGNVAAFRDYGKSSYVYYSKPEQPEAVPDLNFLAIGLPELEVLGLASLRDSLFVFKADGLYRITGTTSADIRVELFDATVQMLPGQFNSISVAGNQVFAICNQGFISVTESGVSVISRAIEDIASRASVWFSRFDSGSLSARVPCGYSSEVGRKYSTVFQPLGTSVPLILDYSFVNNAWTTSLPITMDDAGVTPSGVSLFKDSTDATSESLMYTYMDSAYLQLRPQVPQYAGESGLTFENPASFGYCVQDFDSPGAQTRVYAIAVALTGSIGLTALTFTFTSDSGAAAATMTVPVNANQYSVTVAVPRNHGYSGQLNFTVSGPANPEVLLRVSAVVVYSDAAGDRIPTGGRN